MATDYEKFFRLLDIHISNDLNSLTHVDHCLKKARRRLLFLCCFKRFYILRFTRIGIFSNAKFYHSVNESALVPCVTGWFGSAAADDHNLLNKFISIQHLGLLARICLLCRMLV